MTFIKDILTPAASGFLNLLPLLIIFILFIHIYFISALFASTGLSLRYREEEGEFSRKLSGLFFGKLSTIFLFAILPLFLLAPLYRLALFDSLMKFEQYFMAGMIVLLVGLLLLGYYKKNRRLIGGLFGTLTILLYIFVISVILTLFLFPEKWPFLKGILPSPLFSITPILLFFMFSAIALINAGASMGFIFLRWSELKLPENSKLIPPVRRDSRYLILAGSFILPPVLFLFLFTLPGYSIGKEIFPLSFLLLLFATLSAYTSYPGKDKEPGKGIFTFSFLLSILITFTFSVFLFSFQKNSNIDKMDWAKISAEKKTESIDAGRMELYSKSMKISSEYGEKIYKEQCTACHNFNKTILGPAFNNVVPKYTDDPEKLVDFILDPVKINPDLPSMPDPGLTKWQAKSVAQFIIEKIKNDKNGEKSE